MADVFEMVLANRLAQDAATAAAAGAAGAADAAAAAANAEAVAAAAAAAAADANAVAVGGDVAAIIDRAVGTFLGEGQTGETPDDAGLAFQKVNNDLIDNTNAINALKAEQDSHSSTGMSVNIDFSDYPNGPFPSIFTLTYSGIGTSQLIISGGNAKWDKANNQNRDCLARYNVAPTETDHQLLRGTMASPPEDNTDGGRPHFYACGRMNTSGTDYVWARAWSVGSFFLYKADIGCTIGGVEYVWASGIDLTWSLNMSFVLGVGNNARQYQVFSGQSLMFTFTEAVAEVPTLGDRPVGLTGADIDKFWYVEATGLRYRWNGSGWDAGVVASKRDASHRYWGSLAQLRRDNSGTPNAGGVVSGCSIADNEPPLVKGTTAKFVRTSTGNQPFTGGSVIDPLPTNFFTTPRWQSRDIDYNPATNQYTIKKEGSYAINARIDLSASMSSTCHVILRVNGQASQWGDTQRPGDSAQSIAGHWMEYLRVGDVVDLATHHTGLTVSTLTGEATGSKTYFDITRILAAAA